MAALLALELARDEAVRQAREETRRGDPLPADGPPWVVMLARQGASDGPDDIAAREETRAELRLLMSTRRLVLRGSSESLELRLVAAAPADDPGGLAIAGRLATFLDRTVAVSRPFNEPGARPAAEAAARATLEAADLLPDPAARRPRASRLPAYLLLGNVRNLPDGVRQARELLAPILVGRPDASASGSTTLARRALVAEPRRGRGPARRPPQHDRLPRPAARGTAPGWDLADPELRVALLLAVRVMQNAQELTAAPVLNRNPVA